MTPYAAIQTQWFHTPGYSETDLTGGGFGAVLQLQDRQRHPQRTRRALRRSHRLGNMPLVLRAACLGA